MKQIRAGLLVEGINLAFTERVLPEYQRTNAPEYFQVWLGAAPCSPVPPCSVMACCLGAADRKTTPAHWSLTLPDGRAGRAVGIGYSLESARAAREAWLDAVTNDLLLPGRILSSDYLGQQAWRRRVEVLRDASPQLRTFKRA